MQAADLVPPRPGLERAGRRAAGSAARARLGRAGLLAAQPPRDLVALALHGHHAALLQHVPAQLVQQRLARAAAVDLESWKSSISRFVVVVNNSRLITTALT